MDKIFTVPESDLQIFITDPVFWRFTDCQANFNSFLVRFKESPFQILV